MSDAPQPKTEEERLRYRILELEAENAILKEWQNSTNKNTQNARIVKSLRCQFQLAILLRLTGLKRSTFVIMLPRKDNHAEIAQQINAVYHGNYGYSLLPGC